MDHDKTNQDVVGWFIANCMNPCHARPATHVEYTLSVEVPINARGTWFRRVPRAMLR